jgi:hypothetical protein
VLVPEGRLPTFAAVSVYGINTGIIAACGRAVKFRRAVFHRAVFKAASPLFSSLDKL